MTPGVRPLVLSFSLLAAAILAGCGRSEAQGGPPMAPPVSAAPAVSRDVTLYDEFSGRLEAVGNERWLVLERGQRNDFDDKTGDRTLASFDSYRVLVQEKALREAEARPPRALPTLQLLREPTPRNQGELAWRRGMLLATANLLLLGLGLAATNPRRPSNWNLLFALLAFVVYFNLVNLTQAWVASERAGLGLALAGVHGGAFVLALALLWWRDHAAVVHPGVRRRPAVA